jgi:aerotaxis receptor
MSNSQKTLINIKTLETFTRPEPIGVYKQYDGSAMITETDLDGVITYANRNFIEFIGYERKELIGLPHSIIRHPDVPKGVFKAMWKIIKQKKVWRGYLKNLTREGSHYWALVYIQPKLDSEGNHIGYISNCKDAYPSAIKEVEQKFKELNSDEFIDDPYFMENELFLGDELGKFT